jgi:uncharacterized protein (DUF1800 family)
MPISPLRGIILAVSLVPIAPLLAEVVILDAGVDEDLVQLQARTESATMEGKSYEFLFNHAPTTNVPAVQVHNASYTGSDLTMIPRVLGRTFTPESISESEPNGVWTFRFDPNEHDLGEKILFRGRPEEMTIPAGQAGVDRVNDAIDALVSRQGTAEFICVKLVNKFVSDEIALAGTLQI